MSAAAVSRLKRSLNKPKKILITKGNKVMAAKKVTGIVDSFSGDSLVSTGSTSDLQLANLLTFNLRLRLPNYP
jgi:hypothetical protein